MADNDGPGPNDCCPYEPDYPKDQHNFSTKARPEDFTIKKCEAFKAIIIANVDAGLADSLPTQNAPKDHEWH